MWLNIFDYFCIKYKGMDDFLQYISISPEIRFGKPCIKGTRIAVLDILQWLASGMSVQEVLEDFPSLREEHIRAALAFAAHREMLTKLSAA
jgi:uncharacterized protein (DUF433 family)